jgi:hypothetical protein
LGALIVALRVEADHVRSRGFITRGQRLVLHDLLLKAADALSPNDAAEPVVIDWLVAEARRQVEADAMRARVSRRRALSPNDGSGT